MSRHRLIAAVALVVMGIAPWVQSPAHAQELAQLDLSGALANSAGAPALTTDDLPNSFSAPYRRPGSSTLMAALYGVTASLQALDVHSTLKALDLGAVERNPLMSDVTRHKAAFVALKAGVAFSSVMAARNMAKRNKVAAVATLIAINSAYAMVVQHNYRVVRRLR